ncbi:SNARE associated Golgi protein [Anaeromyxobacter sp. K]|uniref:DedA family protein n=1 Tax=Anaeromyxobacter sp. (strain K) TaxID=447217 RepID=UPI00015F9CC1|nr:DedA family protein [Anaeromyxobacter sp. K]ACG71292.1 SNARE associated Golgi protein [Anaeromyxobacter sp. K]
MLQALLSRFGYLAVLALLAGAGLGVPIPEEATQLGAGALAHQGYLRLPLVIAVCWLGIVLGDLAFFLLARRHGERVLRSRPVARVLTPARRDRLEAHLARHAFLSVAVARHTSGLRLAAFALAATHGVRLRTFALADGLSALLSVPLVVSVGYLFAHHLGTAERGVRRVELAVLGAVLLAAAVAVWLRRRRARAAA